ncbi:multicopper oxidase domain-containing protein [Kitasatospora azatica]|uniref:multicopper oxidase domain-containing protein n=1 Tax=Kitasatospora azatica TaxID=58347 RepID=UPI000560FC6F|nr:multicopper oxidase domain-containing protein [Kitasatospora azatica]
MPVDHTEEQATTERTTTEGTTTERSRWSDSGGQDRRGLVRTLLGGTAALAGAAALSTPAAALPTPPAGWPLGGPTDDPFEVDAFQSNGRVREYWIQADSFEHNAVASGHDPMSGKRFTPAQTTFWAIGFRAYTPGWGQPLDADLGPSGIGANSGIPGPVLRAEVGDELRVHFRNNDEHYKWPHSMHPHGVRYSPEHDGGWLAEDPQAPGTAVPYGADYTYSWFCTPGSVGTWPYHDHSMPQTVPAPKGATPQSADPHASATDGPAAAAEPVMEIGAELGLLGVLAITDQRTAPVDRECVVVLHDVYRTDIPSMAMSLNLLNGGAYLDNTPTFTAKVGDRVRWRVVSLGNELHVFHLHGHRWRSRLAHGAVDSELIGPATTLTIEYTEDNPGDWIYHCHATHHLMGGMAGRYRVSP